MLSELLSRVLPFPLAFHPHSLLLLGVVLFGGTLAGRLFQRFKIPQVIGYIGAGMVLGYSGFRFIDETALANLQPFSSFALGLIGFMIGGELKISTLRKFGRQFMSILLLESLGSFVLVTILTTFVGYVLFGDMVYASALGLVFGAVSSATAPAATTDVLWENKTKGPLTTIVLGIVAMDDGVALVLFALATSIAGNLLGISTGGILHHLLMIGWEIGGSVVLGLGTGFILYRLIRNFKNEDRILAFSISAILLLTGIAVTIGTDMILAAMSMGFFITNFAPRRSKETFKLVEKFTPPIFVLFFVMVGAKINVSSLNLVILALALVFLLARFSGKAAGAWLGARLSRAPATVRRYLPLCLLSQAGVAIGLSIMAGQTFPGEAGNTIMLVITLTTFVVQIAGPVFVKIAVVKAGEAGLNITEDDLILQSSAADICDVNIPVLDEDMSISKVLGIFAQHDNLYYPVVDGEKRLIGIVSIEKLKDTFMAAEFSEFLLVHDIMEPAAYSCGPGTEAVEVSRMFKTLGINSIPMTGPEGKVLGMIEHRKLQQHFTKKIAELTRKADELEHS
ncbi:MAG: cation:proton antiporter [Spirochaetales bacterium]|nr:cation:proton antiporter [Spirochaetales bacterium]